MTRSHTIEGEERQGRWVITVDHASNRVPEDVAGGDLGLPAEDMNRHIAYDVGAAGVARALGRIMDAPVIMSEFSRLVIDPNRGEDDPTLVMRLSDRSVVPGNRHVDAAEVERRLDLYYRPYHDAISRLLEAREAPVILAMHSFTRQFRGRAPRPWHVAVLYGKDTRLAYPFLARLRDEPDLVVGDNQPYTGELENDSMDRHGTKAGRPHVLLEIRNDLIETEAQQEAWAERLAPMLDAALAIAQV